MPCGAHITLIFVLHCSEWYCIAVLWYLNHRQLDRLLNSCFRRTTGITTKLHIIDPLRGGFPAQRVNNAETVIKSWYHHEHGLLWFDASLLHQLPQYSDVIMGAMASQINGVSSICLTVCSGTDQKYIQALRLWLFFFFFFFGGGGGGGGWRGEDQPVRAGFP